MHGSFVHHSKSNSKSPTSNGEQMDSLCRESGAPVYTGLIRGQPSNPGVFFIRADKSNIDMCVADTMVSELVD